MEDALMKMARSSELGIKVVDVRIKQINLPVEVSSSIYQRMRAERTAVAREHRSQGREQADPACRHRPQGDRDDRRRRE